MSKVTVTQMTDPNWGKLVCMSNGLIELRVTIDYGPRVIYCACVGMENMFYEDFTKKPLGEKKETVKKAAAKKEDKTGGDA